MASRHPSTAETRSPRRRRAVVESCEITCWCGRILRGRRLPRFQRLECASCAEVLFVLPLDAYPATSSTKTVRGSDPSQARNRQDANSTAALERATNDAPSTPDDEGPDSPQKPPEVRPDRIEAPTVIAGSPGGRLRSLLTPLRVVTVSIVTVLVLTIWWMIHRAALETAERDFRDYSESGLAALKEGRFAAARDDLTRAVQAAAVLERNDRPARLVRQRLREATAAANLIAEPLVLLCERIERDPAGGGDGWRQQFEDDFLDRWVVLFTSLTTGASGTSDTAGIEFSLFIDGRPVRIEGADVLWEKLADSNTSRRAAFAARLAGLRRDADEWILAVEPSSVFLWTDLQTYRLLGLAPAESFVSNTLNAPDDEQAGEEIGISRLLDRQAELAGIAE